MTTVPEPDDVPATPLPSGAPAKLAALLETLGSEDRQELVTWLLHRRPAPVLLHSRSNPELVPDPANVRQQILSWQPAGEGSQIVTIRLPSDQHERLRTWCTQNNFSMASVIRGLVERFLDHEGRGPAQRESPQPD